MLEWSFIAHQLSLFAALAFGWKEIGSISHGVTVFYIMADSSKEKILVLSKRDLCTLYLGGISIVYDAGKVIYC